MEIIVNDIFGDPVSPYWDGHRYLIPACSTGIIREVLGDIEKRRDGRYTWTRRPSRYYKEWGYYSQGVAGTFEQAQQQIEYGWGILGVV